MDFCFRRISKWNANHTNAGIVAARGPRCQIDSLPMSWNGFELARARDKARISRGE